MSEKAFFFLGLTSRSRFGELEPGERACPADRCRCFWRVIRPRPHTAIHDEKMDSILTHFSFLVVVFLFAGRSSGQTLGTKLQAAFCFFTFAHLALCAAAIFLRAAADSFRRGRKTEFPVPRCLSALRTASRRPTTRCALARSCFNCWTTADRLAIGFPSAKDHSRDTQLN